MPRFSLILSLIVFSTSLAPCTSAQCDLIDENFDAITLGATMNSLPGWRDHTTQGLVKIGTNPCNGTPAIILNRTTSIAERRLNNLPTPEAFRIQCEVAVWSDGDLRMICPTIVQNSQVRMDPRVMASFDVSNGTNVVRNGSNTLPLVLGACANITIEIDVLGLARVVYDGVVLNEFIWSTEDSLGPCTIPDSFTFVNHAPGGITGMAIDNVCVSSVEWNRYCTAASNSTGSIAKIGAFGSSSIAANDFELYVADLPPTTFGYFLAGTAPGFIANPGGSQGNLCLGGAIIRFQQILISSSSGVVNMPVNWAGIPWPTGVPAIVLPGQTWNFQYFHRDRVGGASATNLSEGLSITATL